MFRIFPFHSAFWNFLLKVLVLAGISWALYRQVFARDDLSDIYGRLVQQLTAAHWGWLLLVLVLMPVNWGLEAAKWWRLLYDATGLSYREAWLGVLSGVTLSLFTPNRIGEYGGRILRVPASHNWQAVIATLVGSISQQLVLFSGGIIGMAVFVQNYSAIDRFNFEGFAFIGILIVAALWWCFFNLPALLPLLRRLAPNRRVWRRVLILKHYDRQTLGKVLLAAGLRYAVYTGQYYFILRFYAVDVPLEAALAGIATIFIVQTSIPLPPLLGLLARGELALLVWRQFDAPAVSILAATFSLFIINLCLPALVGAGVIVKTNIIKSLGYEKNDG